MNSLSTPVSRVRLSVLAVGGAATLGIMLGRIQSDNALYLVAAVFVAALTGLILGRFGLRGIASASLGTMTLALAWNEIRFTGFMALSDVFLLAGAILVLPTVLTTSGIGRLRWATPMILPGLVITFGGVLSTALADNPSASLANLSRFALAAVIVPLIISLTITSQTAIRRVTDAWMASVTVSVFYAAFLEVPFFGRVSGLAQHPNHLALTCVLAFGPALSMALSRHRVQQIGFMALSVFFAYGVYLSGSRSGAVGLAATILLTVALKRNARLTLAGVAAVLIMFVAILSGWVKLDPEGDLARLVDIDSAQVANSNLDRQQRLNEQIAEIRENPIVGLGFENALDSHNLVLQLWGASGVAGLVGLVLLVRASIIRPVRLLWLGSYTSSEEGVLLGLIAGFGGFLAADFFQNALWERYFWLFPALTAVYLASERARESDGAYSATLRAHSGAGHHQLRLSAPSQSSADRLRMASS